MLKDILKLAEGQELDTITGDRFARAVGTKLTDEQQMFVNSQIWGFLAAAVSGSADTLFKARMTSRASMPGGSSRDTSVKAKTYASSSSGGT